MTLLEEMARAMSGDPSHPGDIWIAWKDQARAAALVVADRMDQCQSWSDWIRLIDELRGRGP